MIDIEEVIKKRKNIRDQLKACLFAKPKIDFNSRIS